MKAVSVDPNTEATDLERRFSGVLKLYGTQAFQRFQQAHIAVIGLGGVGSWVVEALARSAIGELTLIDLDNIAESNVNRQIHAMSGEFGRAKVEAMAERVRLINPACTLHMIEDFVTQDNLTEILNKSISYVFDCIDNFRTKAAMVAYCRRNKIKIVTVGGAGGLTDPQRIRVADLSRTEQDSLLARTRKLLRADYSFPRNLKRRFEVPCVYSDEQVRYLGADGQPCFQNPETQSASGLNCASGLGSSAAVTASFGLAATAYVLNKIASATAEHVDENQA
jgi:tRNA A37 threonylcarbamoyladenosine dehydratase